MTNLKLNQIEFDDIRKLLYQVSRISLKSGKENLVEARLSKRVGTLKLANFGDYVRYVKADTSGGELAFMVDALTTNKTNFYREAQHFDFFTQQILPNLEKQHPVRIWCAGCSSGEEPYTLAITLQEAWPDIGQRDVKILATDISPTVLKSARNGQYTQAQTEGIPPAILRKYFTQKAASTAPTWAVKEGTKQLIHFGCLNLMDAWPMQGPFDAILCRNVMIYFDRPTQEKLVQRFYQLLAVGGHFFISHSESLTGINHAFNYVQPAVYVR